MNAFNPGVAVVAGVGPGLGASLARKCAKEGCQLGLLARSSDFLETLTNELRDLGAKVLAVSTDISEVVQVAAAFRRIGEELGPVDLLINNASASGPFRQPFVEITPESFTRGWRVGVLGAFLCSQAVIPDMLKKAASFLPARLPRFVDPPSLSAAQNSRCAG